MQAQRRPAEPELAVTDSAVARKPGRDAHVGGWRLRELLGRGGSASVWRAVDGAGRVAALKVPHAHGTDLVRHEHAVLAAVPHPNIVAAVGLVAAQDGAALALEHLPGGDLVALAGGPPEHWLHALHGVLAGARELHARGYAHCDLKARNVLFARDDEPRLIDFATARPLDAPLRRSVATAACTPAASPVTGRAADAFAFAALVYELVTGRLPYGPLGARWQGEAPRPAVATGPVPVRLLAVATGVLCAGGRVRDGLSVFVDGIESGLEAHR
jgi:serine/threonine protein kinase